MSRVLVVANETVEADELLAELRRIEDEHDSVFRVVAPAVAPDHGLGDSWSQAGAIEAAQARLDRTLAVLQGRGPRCRRLGRRHAARGGSARRARSLRRRHGRDLDPPLTRSRWLRKDVVEQVQKLFDGPVVHIVSHVREQPSVEPAS